jgi:hypothetical protein
MTFEQCMDALVAIVRQENITFEAVVSEVDAVVRSYLISFPGDKAGERDRIAQELGDRTSHLFGPLVPDVQRQLVRLPAGA